VEWLNWYHACLASVRMSSNPSTTRKKKKESTHLTSEMWVKQFTGCNKQNPDCGKSAQTNNQVSSQIDCKGENGGKEGEGISIYRCLPSTNVMCWLYLDYESRKQQ
jgi:hypothetical protein